MKGYVKVYSEIEEIRAYIKECKKLSPIERLRYVQERVKKFYELMPPEAKRNFERIRWKEADDISKRF